MHYYLNKLGVEHPDQWCPNDHREKKWKKERKKYGFDSRETWSLDSTFFMWLYEHLKMFMKVADGVVNLNFHKIEIDGVEHTQRQWILMCLEDLKEILKTAYPKDNKDDKERTDRVMKIWSHIYPYMWW